jgi:hypothetical protein
MTDLLNVVMPAAWVPKLIQVAEEKDIMQINPKDKNKGTVEVMFACEPQQLFDIGVKMGRPHDRQ